MNEDQLCPCKRSGTTPKSDKASAACAFFGHDTVFLLFSIISSLSIGEITASKVNYKKMNVSDSQGASSRGPHITYRLTRLIALFILQRKASTSSVRRGDDYKKQDESLERVNDGLTKVLGLFQDIAGSSSSMKNDDVKKLIKDKTRLGWHGSRTKV